MISKFTKKLIYMLLFVLSGTEVYAQSGIYACGHIRRTRTTAIPNLKNSGYTNAILFNVNVEQDGTLTTDYDWTNQRPAEAGGIICQNGKYVFDQYQPYYISDVRSLLTEPTSINRVEICIGGWGNASYDHIKTLIAAQGISENSMLYKNFKALKDAIPEIFAVNNDDEQTYDVNTAAQFHTMMYDLGYKTTVAPYMNKNFWYALVSQLNQNRSGACDLIYLQTYGGGAYNNPSDWNFNGIPMWVGYDCESSSNLSDMVTKFQNWKNTSGVVGGFLWNYNSEARNVNEWASAINRVFKTKSTSSPVATFYSDINYGGYAIGLPVGTFTQAEMALYGIKANDITALKINSGYKVTIYTNADLSGTERLMTASTSWIGTDWNDKICSMKIESTTSGIASETTDQQLSVFPNPTSSFITIHQTQASKLIRIYDAKGKLVKTINPTAENTKVMISDLPKSTYIVKSGNQVTKLLVK
ncbi:MAG: T9SS type A sorting domain-containing protein [Prevotella sp.]